MTMLLRVFALLAAVVFPVRAQDFGPPELIERAKAEGRIMLAKGRRYSVGAALKPVMVLEVVGPDMDGELLARPADWSGADELPKI